MDAGAGSLDEPLIAQLEEMQHGQLMALAGVLCRDGADYHN